MKTIDILHIVPAYWPRAGGVETLVAGMIDGLNRMNGIKGVVVTPRRLGDPHEQIIHEGVEVLPIPFIQSNKAENQLRSIHQAFASIRKIFQQYHPKIIHIHAYSEISTPACIVAEACGIPYIFHVHGLLDQTLPRSYIERVGKAKNVVAVSHSVSKSVHLSTQRESAVDVIPNGIKHISRSDLPKIKGISKKNTILMIGRLEKNKGFEDGIKAIAPLIKNGRDIKVVIIGRGPLERSLKKLAEKEGVADLITFTGEMEYLVTQSYIASSALLLVPSQEIEGFSLVSLEAALLKVPVIASNVGGLPETVEHDYSGTIVEANDIGGYSTAIIRYLDNPALALKHGEQGQKRAINTFNFEVFLSRWISVYDGILNQNLNTERLLK